MEIMDMHHGRNGGHIQCYTGCQNNVPNTKRYLPANNSFMESCNVNKENASITG